MADSNQEKQDQSSSSSLEDNTAMTIEFLRARLLPERSVSRSARQRANELEKRVEELEEQLRIVSRQRKMAEKATADVLSILESRGISDTSEAFDSGSDHEIHGESHEGNGEEQSAVSKRRIDSGSDHNSSPIASRSLSRKNRTDSQRSREKDREPFTKKARNAVSSIGSLSPKHHLGKSCHRIQRRETRMVVELKTDPARFDNQENGSASQPTDVPDCLDSATEIVREGSGSVGDERSIANHLDVDGPVLVKDMEKALEDQAQLIDQYEEMEKAQREWEEKFRENNNSTPDSYDPGIQSDVTEEREEVKAQTPSSTGTYISETEEAKAVQVNVSTEPPKPQANGFVPTLQVDIGDSTAQTSTIVNTIASRFPVQEFAFPTAMQKKEEESPEHHDLRPQNFHHSPHFNHSFGRPSSETGSSSHKGDHLGSHNDLYALVPHNPHNDLHSVLDALKQAKSQLHQKINKSPLELTSSSVYTSLQHLPSAPRISERAEISVGCTRLFRIPTDFAAEEANARANFVGFQSSAPLAPYYPDNGAAISTPDRFPASPSVFPPDDRMLGSRSVMSGPRSSSSLNSRFDPYSETGLSSVNRYNYSSQPSYPPFPELMQRVPMDMGFPRTSMSNGAAAFGMPEDQLPFYGDHGRPNNMYR